jgi:GT2 family glycosyltransferase
MVSADGPAQGRVAGRKAVGISVIIATYNRAALLEECLNHLRRQPFEPGDEVIVVDNGSTDDTSAVIGRHQRLSPVPLRHLEERAAGKSRALARALAVASGDILAFTDDDVNVEPEWLAAIRTAMGDPGVALIGGPVDPRWERGAPPWLPPVRDGYGRLASPLALLDYGVRPADLGARTVVGANLAVRREVAARVGGFAPHLGKLRGTLLSGEDHDFCRRVQAAGLRTAYCPDARVRHWVPADRVRLRYFLGWFFWSGITNAVLEEDDPPPARSIFGVPLYLVQRFAAGLIAAPAAALAGRTATALDYAMDVAFSAGYAAKCWRLVRLNRAAPAQARRTAGSIV